MIVLLKDNAVQYLLSSLFHKKIIWFDGAIEK